MARDLLFKALSDPVRLRMVEMLNRIGETCCTEEDRLCACEIEEQIGLSQPTISHHLKILLQSGLIEAERDGRFTYYRVNRSTFADLANFLQGFTTSILPITKGTKKKEERYRVQ